MIISNLTYTEFATEANNIEGGIAFADAGAVAGAVGIFYAETDTFTNTVAVRGLFSSAGSLSGSSSVAA